MRVMRCLLLRVAEGHVDSPCGGARVWSSAVLRVMRAGGLLPVPVDRLADPYGPSCMVLQLLPETRSKRAAFCSMPILRVFSSKFGRGLRESTSLS